MPAFSSVSGRRRARLFRNGVNQAVRIPKEFEFEGEEVVLRREGNQLVIEPIGRKGLLETLGRLGPLEDEFPDINAGHLPLDSPRL